MPAEALRDYLVILNPSKCGSTWLANTLSVQPYLLSPGEFDFIFFLEYPPGKQWNRATADDPEYRAVRDDPALSPPAKLETLYRLARNRHPGVRMLIDKSPSNVLAFPRYYHLFRESRIVVLHRDPRDVYVSMELFYQNVLANKPKHPEIGTADYLLDRSCLWHAVKNARATLECERLLRRAGIPFLRLTYEELVADYQGTARKVLDFTGLHIPDDAVVIPKDAGRPMPLHQHLAQAQANKPLFRKGIAGDWKNHITTPEARQVLHELMGDLLIELGYEKDGGWVAAPRHPGPTPASPTESSGATPPGTAPPVAGGGPAPAIILGSGDPRYRKNNDVAVFGSGRSGTTWLAEIIAAAGLELIFEPLDPNHVLQCRRWEAYLPLFYRATDYFPWNDVLEKIMTGQIRNEWTHRHRPPDGAGEASPSRPQRKIFKFIRANLMAEWILAHFPLNGVFIIRNPLAVVASMRKEGWEINTRWVGELLGQARFRQPFLEPLPGARELADRELTQAEAAAVFWSLNNLIPREIGLWNRIPLVIYEELRRDPEAVMGELAPHLGIQLTGAVRAQYTRPSLMTGKQPGGRKYDPTTAWKTILSPGEIRAIVDVVERFGLERFLGEV